MFQQVFHFISTVGAVQGVLLSLVFLFGKSVPASRKLLGWYVLLFSLGLLEPYVEANWAGYLWGQVMFTLLAYGNFLYGPLLYLFVYYLVRNENVFRRGHLLHFVPFIAGVSLELVQLFSGMAVVAGELYDFIAFELLIAHILTYNILTIYLLHRHGHALLEVYSNLEANDLRWLKGFVILLTVIYVVSFTITHLIAFGVEVRDFYLLVQLAITVAIYALSYRAILRPKLFYPDHAVDIAQGAVRYERSGLKPEKAKMYEAQLREYMEQEKPYLDPALSVYTLAEKLEIPRHHLTQVINECFQKNFYAFVNDYRVEEVQRMILDPKFSHFNLSALGLEAGFKSKTAFNNNFKKVTGLTPSEWRRNMLNNGKSFSVKDVQA